MPVCDLFPDSPASRSLAVIASKIDKIVTLFNRNNISHNTSKSAEIISV